LKNINSQITIELINKFFHCWQGRDNLREILLEFWQEKNQKFEISQEEIDLAYQQAQDYLEQYQQWGINLISVVDSQFPQQLKLINNPPLLLYIKGDLNCLQPSSSVAVIGTRKPTQFGRYSAWHIGFTLAKSDLIVVSGLALGCDTSAHKGCLQAQGKTLAVMAHGLHTTYPRQNRVLAEQILEQGGCLISEYPYGENPQPSYFVARDRIQSGLSSAVIVIETDMQDGTWHTVKFALAQQRMLACLAHPPAKQTIQSTRPSILF
jgi:DNA processing protein